MAVKRSQSATRVLAALEGVAAHQPVGVSALARLLCADKSATQRALMTLADAGWIRAAPGGGSSGHGSQWELTPHILSIAHVPHSLEGLRQRARAALEAIRAETGETAYLTVPDRDQFVIVDAVESRQMLRMVAPVGMAVEVRRSATGRAILPFLSPARQAELLGGPPDAAMLAEQAATRMRGYSISDGDIERASIGIAAAILLGGEPVGALLAVGPNDRIDAAKRRHIGEYVSAAARRLSDGPGML